MTQLGLDYSFARPGGAALKQHGVVGVGRYLSSGSKGLTADELADLKSNGIGVWLVYEGPATGMLGGKAQGVTDAHSALSMAASLGLTGAPIYWAADFDIAPGSADCAAADEYVAGWNTIIPKGQRGGYGGLWYLSHVGANVDYKWECASTSFRHGVQPSQVDLDLQQTVDQPPLPSTDYNHVFKTDSFAGQTGSDDMPLNDDDKAWITSAIQDQASNIAVAVLTHGINSATGSLAQSTARFNTILADLQTKIDAGTTAAGPTTTLDVDTLASEIVESIAKKLAS